jgi:signal transduction histidine kinase
VRDTGCGIPADQLANRRAVLYNQEEGGMGFGVWRAKTLVEPGGKISATSELGCGTVFTIRAQG